MKEKGLVTVSLSDESYEKPESLFATYNNEIDWKQSKL